MLDFNREFCQSCQLYLLDRNTTSLQDALAKLAGKLLDPDTRIEVGVSQPYIWAPLRELWLLDSTSDVLCYEEPHYNRNLALAKFTRNLVAGCPLNQTRAFENVPSLCRFLHQCTSYVAMQEVPALKLAQMLVQLTSNMVTANPTTAESFWNTTTNSEPQDMLLRLLAASDSQLLFFTFTLIQNSLISTENLGVVFLLRQENHRLCIALLDSISRLSNDPESGESDRAFAAGYGIVEQVIAAGHFPTLYEQLSIEGEPIAPHQATLLKLLDANLQNVPINEIHQDRLVQKLVDLFLDFSTYIQRAIRASLGHSGAQNGNASNQDNKDKDVPLQDLDLLLPKVCEALILVIQCIITVALDNEKAAVDQPRRTKAHGLTQEGCIETIIETLRLLSRFVPRIVFGKPVSDTGQPPSQTADPTGFAFVKRDLVRLLGILCHDDRAVQERVRSCEGIPVVMNLCTVDERNPYIREHSIFTLHNLLKNNRENQKVVNEMKLMGTWDERLGNVPP